MRNENGELSNLVAEFRESKLLKSRTLFLSEAVDASVARHVISDLLILNADSHEPIKLFINSPGGEVNSGFAIFDTIRFIESDVWIVNAGLCASIATIVNIAAKKEHRFSLPNAKFLIHQPLIGGHFQAVASDLEIHAAQIIKTREKINELLALECGQPLKKVEQDTTRDYWMDAAEALEYGLISKVITRQSELK